MSARFVSLRNHESLGSSDDSAPFKELHDFDEDWKWVETIREYAAELRQDYERTRALIDKSRRELEEITRLARWVLTPERSKGRGGRLMDFGVQFKATIGVVSGPPTTALLP